jgi:hypothetical protein
MERVVSSMKGIWGIRYPHKKENETTPTSEIISKQGIIQKWIHHIYKLWNYKTPGRKHSRETP